MAQKRKWIVGALIVAGGFAAQPAWAAPPADARVAELMQQLKSERHAVREAAVVELAVVGPSSVPAIVATAASKDLESSWRATETLQILCRSADTATAKKVQTELAKLSRSTEKPHATIAQKLLREWPALRHNYAVGQLELLGAEIAEISPEQMLPAQAVAPAGGAMPFGGFFGLLPAAGGAPIAVDFGGPVEAVEVVEAEEVVVEDIERIVEVGDPAPKAAGFKFVEKLIKAVGRVTGVADKERKSDIELVPDAIPTEVEIEEVLPDVPESGLERAVEIAPDAIEPEAAEAVEAEESIEREAAAEAEVAVVEVALASEPEAAEDKPADEVEDKPAEAATPAPDETKPAEEAKEVESKPADVEFIEEAPAEGGAAAVLMEAMDGLGGRMIFRGGGFGFGMPGGPGMMWTAPSQPAQPVDIETLQPGMMRIGKDWRGGDTGLEFTSELQQVHTLILADAPITDAALHKLRGMTHLSQLKVTGNTRLTSAGLLRFHQLRPNVNITAIGPAALGVTGADHPQGFLVQAVAPETGARRAGIDEQDIITKVGGLKVRTLAEVTLALYDKKVGGKVQIEYLRGGKRRTADITLTERELVPTVSATPQVHHQIYEGSFDLPTPAMMIEDLIRDR